MQQNGQTNRNSVLLLYRKGIYPPQFQVTALPLTNRFVRLAASQFRIESERPNTTNCQQKKAAVPTHFPLWQRWKAIIVWKDEGGGGNANGGILCLAFFRRQGRNWGREILPTGNFPLLWRSCLRERWKVRAVWSLPHFHFAICDQNGGRRLMKEVGQPSIILL